MFGNGQIHSFSTRAYYMLKAYIEIKKHNNVAWKNKEHVLDFNTKKNDSFCL